MTADDYEAGKRAGKIEEFERLLCAHNARLDQHERRLQIQERITYGLLGAIALIELAPVIKGLI